MKSSWLKIIASFFAIALIAAACGGSDSDSGSSDTASTSDTETATTEAAKEDVIESGTEAEGDVDTEVEEVVSHLKSFGPPDYKSGVVEGPDDDKSDSIDLVLGLTGASEGEDVLYDQAVAIVLQDRKCSTSYIQRKLAIGYNKAARLVEQMEEEGLVSPANHVGKRDILVPEQP